MASIDSKGGSLVNYGQGATQSAFTYGTGTEHEENSPEMSEVEETEYGHKAHVINKGSLNHD